MPDPPAGDDQERPFRAFLSPVVTCSGPPERHEAEKFPRQGVTRRSLICQAFWHVRRAHEPGGIMTLPRSHAYLGRPPHAPYAASLEPRYQTEGRPVAGRPARSRCPAARPGSRSSRALEPRSPDAGRSQDGARSRARATSGSLPSERVWEQRRALGRQLASLRSRSGFSQWEFAPLTGYSRSTLSDAELGRHRLRREFWERCDSALMTDGVLTAAYDRIEVAATALRRSARSQAQAAREEQAARRLQALLPAPGLPAPGAVGLGAASAAGPAPVAAAAPQDLLPSRTASPGDRLAQPVPRSAWSPAWRPPAGPWAGRSRPGPHRTCCPASWPTARCPR